MFRQVVNERTNSSNDVLESGLGMTRLEYVVPVLRVRHENVTCTHLVRDEIGKEFFSKVFLNKEWIKLRHEYYVKNRKGTMSEWSRNP